MNLIFENDTNYIISQTILNLIDSCILESLKTENFNKNFIEKVEISMSLVYNSEIQKINYEFRGLDKPTDVLSFPILDKDNLEILKNKDNINNINNINNIVPLGDIVISIDKVLEQAHDYNHSVEREICFLIVHSMLHLLGYDHMTKKEETKMFAKQDIILNNLNILR